MNKKRKHITQAQLAFAFVLLAILFVFILLNPPVQPAIGAFAFCVIFSMTGFTLGLTSLISKKIQNNATDKALAIFSIVVPIVFFILPAFHKHGHPPRIYCQSNCHTLSICFQIYHIDEGPWPAKDNWCDLIKPYLEKDDKYWKCPKDETGPCSYAMNENIPDDANELPDDMVLLFESAPGWNLIGGPDDVVTNRHKRPGASITFVDGRVEFVKPEDIPNLRWTVEE